jgi:hypothetical protein
MSGSQKVPVTISMDPTQLARLDQIAADLDRSRSWVATRALGAFLAVTDSPSPHHRGSPAAEAEPPGAGVRHTPVPRLAPMEHHLTRVAEAARRQAADAQAGRDTAFAQSAKYIADLGTSE